MQETAQQIECATVVRSLRPDWAQADIRLEAYLPGGYSHRNFQVRIDGNAYVLRIADARSAGASPWPAEFGLQESAAYLSRLPQGLAPELVAADSVTGNLLTHFVQGPLLADCQDAASPDVVARYLQRLHSRLPVHNRTYDPRKHCMYMLETNRIPKAECPSWLQHALQQPAVGVASLVACHNDLNPWNIINSSAGWVTLDWEWSANGDPLFDVVTLCEGLGFAAELVTHVAARYLDCVVSPELAHRVQRQRGLFWAREYCWAQLALFSGHRRAEIHAQLTQASEQLQALESAGLRKR